MSDCGPLPLRRVGPVEITPAGNWPGWRALRCTICGWDPLLQPARRATQHARRHARHHEPALTEPGEGGG